MDAMGGGAAAARGSVVRMAANASGSSSTYLKRMRLRVPPRSAQLLKGFTEIATSVALPPQDGAPGSAPQIDLEAAAVLDHLLDLAASYGIRLLIALDSFNSLCPPSVSQYCLYEHSVWSALLARHGKLGFLEFWQ